MDKDGVEPVLNFADKVGEGSIFLRFCANVFYGRPITIETTPTCFLIDGYVVSSVSI